MNGTDLTTEKTHSGWALGCTCNHLHPPEIKDAKEMLYEFISREKVALQLTNACVFFPSCSYQTLPLLKQPVFILADTLFTKFRWQTLRIKHHKISNTISVVKVWAIGLHDINTFCCTCRRCIHFRLWKSTHGSCTAAWKRGPCRYHRPVKEKKSYGQMLSLSWSPQGWSLSLDWRTS